MTDTTRHELTEWEQRAVSFTREQFRNLHDIDKTSVQVARAKVAVNASLYKLEQAEAALPWPCEEVQLWCREIHSDFGTLFGDIQTACSVDDTKRQLFYEDHTEYLEHFTAVKHYRDQLNILESYQKKVKRIEAAIVNKKNRKRSQTGDF